MADAGHWYEPKTGEPRHTYIDKYGEEKSTTLREARPKGWVPSFSGVWGVKSSYQLENWKINNAFLASADTPQYAYEGKQSWIDRARELYIENTTKARDIGTEIHRAIEDFLAASLEDATYAKHVTGAIGALQEWCGLDGIISEKTFAHPMGYGGQVDVHKKAVAHGSFVADFKSTEFDGDALPKCWPNHFAQLAAYRHGLGMPDARCAIIYVSTSVPGLAHLVEIPEKDLRHGWELFVKCLDLWQCDRKYWPVKKEELV